MGYLCANFSLPRSLCSRVKPDVGLRDSQTYVRQKNRLMPQPYGGGIITALVTGFPFVQSRGDIHYTVLPRGGAYYALVLSVRHVRSSKSRMESHANVEFGEVFPHYMHY